MKEKNGDNSKEQKGDIDGFKKNQEIGKRAIEAVLVEDGNPYLKVYKLNAMKK